MGLYESACAHPTSKESPCLVFAQELEVDHVPNNTKQVVLSTFNSVGGVKNTPFNIFALNPTKDFVAMQSPPSEPPLRRFEPVSTGSGSMKYSIPQCRLLIRPPGGLLYILLIKSLHYRLPGHEPSCVGWKLMSPRPQRRQRLLEVLKCSGSRL